MFTEKFICISLHQHCFICGLMGGTEQHKTTSARVTIIKKTIKSASENVEKVEKQSRRELVTMGSSVATLKKFSILNATCRVMM